MTLMTSGFNAVPLSRYCWDNAIISSLSRCIIRRSPS